MDLEISTFSLFTFFTLFLIARNVESSFQCYTGKVTSTYTVNLSVCHGGTLHNSTTMTNATTDVQNSTEHVKESSYCTIFRHVSDEATLTFNHSSYVKFGCDVDGICDGKLLNKFTRIGNKSFKGELYCCNTSTCNLPQLTPLPKQALKCYQSSKEGSGSIIGCRSRGGHCAHTSENKSGILSQQYFCDLKNICVKNASIITEGCKNLTLDNNTRSTIEICCCTSSLCNKPPWDIRSTAVPFLNATAPSNQKSGQHIDWLFIGGLLALIVVLVGVIGGTVALCRKRRKEDCDPNLNFRYQRVRADHLEDSDIPEVGDNVHLVIT